jgi:hypothetical protein
MWWSSVVNSLILRPLDVPQPANLFQVAHSDQSWGGRWFRFRGIQVKSSLPHTLVLLESVRQRVPVRASLWLPRGTPDEMALAEGVLQLSRPNTVRPLAAYKRDGGATLEP